MSGRIEITHRTGYEYAKPVAASYNEARLTPMTTPEQVTLDARVTVTPTAPLFRYWDYWGTLVHSFDLHQPHDKLVVTSSSVVQTSNRDRDPPLDALDASWSLFDDPSVCDQYFEFLMPSYFATADDELADQARTLRAQAAMPRESVALVMAWVREQLTYTKGATNVMTSAVEARRTGHGVCQDFVHLSIALLREMGIPCRYASGYFDSRLEAEVGETSVGESHAWAEAWIDGWYPFDPTNDVPVGESHVLVALGRDYRDVTPLKGVYSGSPSSTTSVTVELTRRA
jgi:transglutaminase-like putative cysteine protease